MAMWGWIGWDRMNGMKWTANGHLAREGPLDAAVVSVYEDALLLLPRVAVFPVNTEKTWLHYASAGRWKQVAVVRDRHVWPGEV